MVIFTGRKPVLLATAALLLLTASDSWAFKCGAQGTPWFISTSKIEMPTGIEGAAKELKQDSLRSHFVERLEFTGKVPTLVLVKSDSEPNQKAWHAYIEKAAREAKPIFSEKMWNDLLAGQPVSVDEMSRASHSKPQYLFQEDKVTRKKLIKDKGQLYVQLSEKYGPQKTWVPNDPITLKNRYSLNRPKNVQPPGKKIGPTFFVVQENRGHVLKTWTEYRVNENYNEASYAEAEKRCAEGLKAWEVENRRYKQSH